MALYGGTVWPVGLINQSSARLWSPDEECGECIAGESPMRWPYGVYGGSLRIDWNILVGFVDGTFRKVTF